MHTFNTPPLPLHHTRTPVNSSTHTHMQVNSPIHLLSPLHLTYTSGSQHTCHALLTLDFTARHIFFCLHNPSYSSSGIFFLLSGLVYDLLFKYSGLYFPWSVVSINQDHMCPLISFPICWYVHYPRHMFYPPPHPLPALLITHMSSVLPVP